MTDIGGPAPGEMQLYDTVKPPLPAGRYKLRAQTTVTGGPFPLSGKDSFFTIEGPRFALPASEVSAVHPPRNAQGSFDQVLPHIVLGRRTLPWERELDPQGLIPAPPPELDEVEPRPLTNPIVPWLALRRVHRGSAGARGEDRHGRQAQHRRHRRGDPRPAGRDRRPRRGRRRGARAADPAAAAHQGGGDAAQPRAARQRRRSRAGRGRQRRLVRGGDGQPPADARTPASLLPGLARAAHGSRAGRPVARRRRGAGRAHDGAARAAAHVDVHRRRAGPRQRLLPRAGRRARLRPREQGRARGRRHRPSGGDPARPRGQRADRVLPRAADAAPPSPATRAARTTAPTRRAA